MSEANKYQVGGEHYKSKIQHWDYVVANDLDYFQAQITKYVTRWRKKAGITDLEKGLHFLEKYIEVEKMKLHNIRIEPVSLQDLDNNRLAKVPRPDGLGMQYPRGYDQNIELGECTITADSKAILRNATPTNSSSEQLEASSNK